MKQPTRCMLKCMMVDKLLSPVDADRVAKYLFVPAPDNGPIGKPDTFELQSAVFIYGAIGQFQTGQQYEFNLTPTEG